MTTGRILAIGGVTLLAAIAAAPVAHAADPTAAEIVATLNAERTLNGVPTVTEDPEMSSACRLHNQYALTNGWDANPHSETPGKPGFTVEGDRAARRSVLHSVSTWADGDPYASAPYHLYQLMDPSLLRTGADESSSATDPNDRFGCVWTVAVDQNDQPATRPLPPTPRLFSAPGNGRTDVSFFEFAEEFFSIPAFDLGLTNLQSGPFLSGKNLFVYYQGPVDAQHPDLQTLCDVQLRTPGSEPVEAPFTDGGIIVPRQVMLPSARYSATVTFSTTRPCDATKRFTSSFAFTTAARPPAESMMHFADPVFVEGRLRVPLSQTEPLSRGAGSVTAQINNQAPTTHNNLWGNGGHFFIETLPTGATFTVTQTNAVHQLGPICWSPTSVARTYTRTAAGATAAAPVVSHPSPDVCGAPPAIDTLAPTAARSGDRVIITGTGLASTSAVRFGTIRPGFTALPDGRLQVRVPDGAVDGAYEITTATGTVTAPPLDVTLSVHRFAPPLGAPVGTTVTIVGEGFHAKSAVYFGGVRSTSVRFVAPSTLLAVVPPGALTGKIAVFNRTGLIGKVTSRNVFNVTPSVPPVVTTMTPSSGPVGTTVNIDGSGFNAARRVFFNGREANYSIQTPGRIRAVVPAGATTGPVTVVTPLGSGTSTGVFTVG